MKDIEDTSQKRRGVTRRTLVLVSTLTLLVVIGLATASLTLVFTQPIPGNVEAGTAIQPGCADPTSQYAVPLGGGAVVVSCGSGPAFNVTSLSLPLTPTFTLPASGVAGLYAVYGSGVAGSCSGGATDYLLVSGSAVPFEFTGPYVYCVNATSAYAGFSVGWSE
jgi:hypothetical protein